MLSNGRASAEQARSRQMLVREYAPGLMVVTGVV
jgi:hypothetical protein